MPSFMPINIKEKRTSTSYYKNSGFTITQNYYLLCFCEVKRNLYKMYSSISKQIKLEKEAETLKCSGDGFLQFLNRMDSWIALNIKKIMDLFRKFDSDDEGFLTFEEFKSGNLF